MSSQPIDATPLRAARSSRLPDGVCVQPRKFTFDDLDSVPQYWFGDNKLITHMENAFSMLIPPGERFFIRSVQNYEDRISDPDLKDLVRAFYQQEAFHTRAHIELNDSFKRFGVDVDREIAYADQVIAKMARRLPKKMQLGVTVFLEHLTATGAHMLFAEPAIAKMMDPELLRFWRWHAVEELEHKAVAFDVFEAVGGGYVLRVLSAIAAILFLAVPFNRIAQRMAKSDPRPLTDEMRSDASRINKKMMGPQLRMLAQYFKPGFHPWNFDDRAYLLSWYEETAGAVAEGA
jgi:hypothetical protein